MRVARELQTPLTFRRVSDFDKNGVIYWIGSNARCEVDSKKNCLQAELFLLLLPHPHCHFLTPPPSSPSPSSPPLPFPLPLPLPLLAPTPLPLLLTAPLPLSPSPLHRSADWVNPATKGLVVVSSSEGRILPYGSLDDILSREESPKNCHTKDDRNSWFAIDLGLWVCPTAYTLRHARGYGR